MPSKRKGAVQSTSGNKSSDPENDEDYRKKRDRNNQAVKRSRVKSKQKTMETQSKVNELRVKNKVLEGKIEGLKKELELLKDLFLAQAKAKSDKVSDADIKRLLVDDDDSDDGLLDDDHPE